MQEKRLFRCEKWLLVFGLNRLLYWEYCNYDTALCDYKVTRSRVTLGAAPCCM